MYPSRHHYFTLKDSQGHCGASCSGGTPPPCASARRERDAGHRRRADHVFPQDGRYQSVLRRLTRREQGDLRVAEQLKEKLLREGLFDQAWLTPLPAYPRRIA